MYVCMWENWDIDMKKFTVSQLNQTGCTAVDFFVAQVSYKYSLVPPPQYFPRSTTFEVGIPDTDSRSMKYSSSNKI